jgi:hypothetical protein
MVANLVTHLEKNPPSGCQPEVLVYLVGEPEPVKLTHVETEPERPWVLLRSLNPETTSDASSRDDRHIFVHEQHVGRIEVRFTRRQASEGLGFDYREKPPDTSSP